MFGFRRYVLGGLVGCALVWFGGDVLAVPVPVTSHPPPLSVAVVQIEVNGASSLSPSLPLVCSSRFYVSRVVIVLPTEMTIGVVLYTYLSFVYLNTCLGCLAVSTIATVQGRSDQSLTILIQSLMFSAQKFGVSPPESLMLSLNLKDDCSFYFGSTLQIDL